MSAVSKSLGMTRITAAFVKGRAKQRWRGKGRMGEEHELKEKRLNRKISLQV